LIEIHRVESHPGLACITVHGQPFLPSPVSEKSLLLIQVGTPPDDIRAQAGDLPLWFSAVLAAGPAFKVVRVFDGEPLPPHDAHSAAIITGSWAMVTDRLPWSEAAAQWIRDAMALGFPLFGVCYGHQLMAHALGGKVDYHPKGREMGCLDIDLLAGADEEALLAGSGPRFKAHLTHMQTVLELPPGARVLARSAHDPHQVVRYGAHAVSTQFHPEFSQKVAAACIQLRAKVLQSEGFDPQAMLEQLRDTPVPQRMLQRFVAAYACPPATAPALNTASGAQAGTTLTV